MAGGGFDVKGAARLRATLLGLGVDVQDFKAIHDRVASYVGAEGAARAPRRSGLLAASWRPGSQKANATVRFGGAGVPYANAVHWGTGPRPGRRGPHNIRPTLFATSAAAETEPTWAEWYFTELEAMVSRVRGD
jgi:hypothetical protein